MANMGEIDHSRTGSSEDHPGGDQDVPPHVVEEAPVRKLPDDLPTSLDDRKPAPTFSAEAEMYDGWQGVHSIFNHPWILIPSWNGFVPICYFWSNCHNPPVLRWRKLFCDGLFIVIARSPLNAIVMIKC